MLQPESSQNQLSDGVMARTEAGLRQQTERLQLLSDSLGQLMGTPHPEEILRKLLGKIATHLGTDTFFNFMLDDETGLFRLHSHAGLDAGAVARLSEIAVRDGLVGIVGSDNGGSFICDLADDGQGQAAFLKSLGYGAYIGLPLRASQRLLGTISFAMSARCDFSADQRDFLNTVAHYIAITLDQRQTAAAVHENVAHLRLALEAANLGDFSWDSHTDLIQLSERGREIFGITHREPMTRHDMRHLLHEEDRDRARDANLKAIATRSDYDIEYRVILPSGETRWVMTRGRGTYGPGGEPTGMLGVVQDITERKRNDEALRESELRFRTLADNIVQFAWSLDAAGKRLWLNKRFCEYTGVGVEQLDDGVAKGLHHPDHYERVTKKFAHHLKSGLPWEDVFPLKNKDGSYRWFLARAIPIRDEQGKILRWFGTHTDITEIKQIQASLDQRTRTLEILNRVSDSLVAELDLDKIVQSVTDAAREISNAAFGAFFYNKVDENGDSYMLYALSGAPREAFEKFGMPRKTPIFGPTFSGEKIVRIGDVLKDPRYGHMSPHHGMPKGHLPVRSYLAVPVVARSGEVIGGLFFGHPETDIFTEESERMVGNIAAQAAIAIDNATLYKAVQRELAEQKKGEARLRSQKEALEQIVQEWPLSEILENLTGNVERLSDRKITATIQLMEADEKHLRLGAGLGAPKEWREKTARLEIGPNVGSCGTAAFRGERVVVSDIETDPLWTDFKSDALKHGFRACWSSPIFSARGKVLGTFAVYHFEATSPTRAEIDAVEIATRMAAIAIERKQSQEALKESRQQLQEHAQTLETRVAERTTSLTEAVSQMEEFSYTVSHDLRAPLRGMQIYSGALLEDFGAILPSEARHYLDRIVSNASRLDKMIVDLLTFSRMARGEVQLERVSLDRLIRELVQHYPAMQSPQADIQIEPLLDVLGHEPSLTQVLSNLLSNAIKFVPAGTLPRVRVRTEKRNDKVRLWVVDNGIGVDPKYQHRLFNMFERLHPNLKYDGTGVGLAIVRRAVERMGGSVGVESDVKNGSQFWVELNGKD